MVALFIIGIIIIVAASMALNQSKGLIEENSSTNTHEVRSGKPMPNNRFIHQILLAFLRRINARSSHTEIHNQELAEKKHMHSLMYFTESLPPFAREEARLSDQYPRRKDDAVGLSKLRSASHKNIYNAFIYHYAFAVFADRLGNKAEAIDTCRSGD